MITPQPTLCRYDPDASQRLESHLRAISKKRATEDSLAAAIWSRSGEKMHRLAVIAAAAEKTFHITRRHIDWAIALQNALTRRLIRRISDNVAENEEDNRKKRVLRILGDVAQMKKSELTKRTPGFTRAQRDQLLGDLAESHQIERYSTDTSGRPVEWIRRVY